jgi:Ca2+/Na+ antiporter
MMKNDILSTLLIGGGGAAIAASLYVAAFNPQLSIWAAVLIGAVIGSPMLFLGFRLGLACWAACRTFSEVPVTMGDDWQSTGRGAAFEP